MNPEFPLPQPSALTSTPFPKGSGALSPSPPWGEGRGKGAVVLCPDPLPSHQPLSQRERGFSLPLPWGERRGGGDGSGGPRLSVRPVPDSYLRPKADPSPPAWPLEASYPVPP